MTEISPTQQTYKELQDAYTFFNHRLFDEKLPPCLITLQREKKSRGYFSPSRFINRDGVKTDEIALNPVYFAVRTIPETLSTLVHEMVHLYQQHFGNPGRGRYHNKEWADLMEERGLMPTSTGAPNGRRVGDCMTHYIMEGGPFDLACEELVTQSFMVSWMDRFPPYSAVVASIPKTGGGVESLMGGEVLLVDGEDQGDQESLNPSVVEMENRLKGLGVECQTKITNRSNRMKFVCAGCGASAWGKPDLKILCGNEGEMCFGHRMRPQKVRCNKPSSELGEIRAKFCGFGWTMV